MNVGSNIVYGAQVTAIGLVVVFLGLAILIAFISLMAQVFKAVEGRKADKVAEAKRAEEAARAAESKLCMPSSMRSMPWASSSSNMAGERASGRVEHRAWVTRPASRSLSSMARQARRSSAGRAVKVPP